MNSFHTVYNAPGLHIEFRIEYRLEVIQRCYVWFEWLKYPTFSSKSRSDITAYSNRLE